MSGPKTSRHTLTLEQRRRLEERLKKLREEQIRKEKVTAAQKTLNVTIQRLTQTISDVEKIPETNRENDINLAVLAVKEQIQKASSYLKSENIKGIYAMVDDIEAAADNVQLSLNNHAIKQREMKLEKSEALDNFIARGFTVEFKKMPNFDAVKRNQYYEKIREAMSSLGGLHISSKAMVRLQEIKTKAQEIDSPDYIENYYAITVFPFVQECKKYNREYCDYFDEFTEVLSTYKTLLQECNLPYEFKTEEFSLELMNQISEEVHKLQDRILKEEEEAYISRCIDEAMDEMGYQRVGYRDVTKKSGKHFRHELYKFAEGTAVDVTYSDDGQVIMELGAVDDQDRAPSEDECRSLMEDMEMFCSSYSKLEEILREKGVIRRNISILPVSAEYAQIINKTDYKIENDMEGYAQSDRGKASRWAGHKEPLAKHIGE